MERILEGVPAVVWTAYFYGPFAIGLAGFLALATRRPRKTQLIGWGAVALALAGAVLSARELDPPQHNLRGFIFDTLFFWLLVTTAPMTWAAAKWKGKEKRAFACAVASFLIGPIVLAVLVLLPQERVRFDHSEPGSPAE